MDKARVASRIKALAGRVKALGPVLTRDALGLAGLAAIVRGVALINVPAGWIVGGGFMVAAAFLLSKRGE